MKKLLVMGVAALTLTASSMAGTLKENAGCGLGTMLMEDMGQDSLLFQLFAVTTNGTFGNQTFGMTSGTLGCKKPKRLVENKKLQKFIAQNMDSVAQDIAAGNGESLETIAELMNIPEDKKMEFFSTLQSHFSEIFSSEKVEAADVINKIAEISNS